MMKLGERLVVMTVCVLLATLISMMIYNEMAYLKALQLKMQLDNGLQSKFEQTSEKMPIKLEEKLKHPKNVLKAETTAMNIEKRKEERKPDGEYNLTNNSFSDLHKYSLHNPDFRLYMEWPPMITVSPHNPNVAQIWNVPIKPDAPNWLKFHSQISKQYLYEDSEVIDNLLHDLATEKIIAVETHPGGTQFKLIVHFENGGLALFKPMRTPKYEELFPNYLYYTEFEKHYSEIASFHLDRILGFRRAPPVVGRKVNVTGELYRLADKDFLETFFISPDGNHCFHGKCRLFCDVHHAFCGDPHMLEGSFAAYLPTSPRQLLDQRLIRSPWRRTYEHWVKAEWEKNPEYCSDYVINTIPFTFGTRRIYDAMDVAIFDYLIGNMDRHHFDEFTVFGNDSTPTIIHMDNGRGFGKPYHDEMSILIPLMQCCVIRLSTFNTLYNFHIGPKHLSDLMRESLAKDPLSPVLTEAHLRALDRRVNKILAVIRLCVRENIPSVVFLDDIV